MKYLVFGFGLLLCVQFSSCKNANANTIDTESKKSDVVWQMNWSDEFDSDGLPSSDKWDYQEGDGCPEICGWGNNEKQYYTKSKSTNARVENGKLIIEAHKEITGASKYSSAKLITKGKKSWTSGKIEIRAKLPTGLGTWPAIWMMPESDKYGGWPKSGEIDIMEHVGYCPDTIYGTVHTEAYNHMINTQKGSEILIPDAEAEFHEYSIIWNADKIEWYIDGKKYHTFQNEKKSYKEWPFDHPFYLILNVAVGGNWGGKHGVAEDIWPQRMEVDYVRAYKQVQ